MKHLETGSHGRTSALRRPSAYGVAPVALMLALLAIGCAGERALVERWDHEVWLPENFQLTAVTGQRDGSRVSFSFQFKAEGPRRLSVQGTVILDPRARLSEGRWVEEGSGTSRSGRVSAAHPDFLGGQGGLPSLGGQFTLSHSEGVLYRLNVRPVVLSAPVGER